MHQQYERMLEESGEYLETAQQKLKFDASPCARDIGHLEQQLKAHQVRKLKYLND